MVQLLNKKEKIEENDTSSVSQMNICSTFRIIIVLSWEMKFSIYQWKKPFAAKGFYFLDGLGSEC